MGEKPGLSFKTPGQFRRKQKIDMVRGIYDENTKSKALDRALDIAINIYELREEITNKTNESFLGRILGAGKEKGFSFRQRHLDTSIEDFKEKYGDIE